MRAVRWRAYLVDDYEDLRKVPFPVLSKPHAQIDLDVRRTPSKCRDMLRSLLMHYTRQVSGMGYCQGFNFLAAVLLRVFLASAEPKHALSDAFWAFHAVVGRVRCFYPLSAEDDSPVLIMEASAKLIRMHVEMETRLYMQEDFEMHLTCFLLRHWPCLFSTMFESVEEIWDYLLERRTRSRLFCLTTAMFTSKKNMLPHLSTLQLFQIVENEGMHSGVLAEAQRLAKWRYDTL